MAALRLSMGDGGEQAPENVTEPAKTEDVPSEVVSETKETIKEVEEVDDNDSVQGYLTREVCIANLILFFLFFFFEFN